jgi:hypothetical protein
VERETATIALGEITNYENVLLSIDLPVSSGNNFFLI